MKGQNDHARENNNSYILGVDDDSDIVRFIEQALNRHGFKVSAFTDPAMALEDFKVNYKDCILILSDIRMPAMNGYEFVKHVKKKSKSQGSTYDCF
jgi:CheY-like chemotaxis protein